jgi:hypothetical protein
VAIGSPTVLPGQPQHEKLDFVFNITGGDAAPLYEQLSGQVAIRMDYTGFAGSFEGSFDNLISGMGGLGDGVSDTAPITPEPTSMLAWSGLLLATGAFRLRRRNAALRQRRSTP